VGYTDQNIEKIVSNVNEKIYLPGLQREYVWDQEQIVRLFDSLMRDIPINTFLFWEVSGDYAENQIKYKFVEDYITEELYPSSFDNRSHHNTKIENDFDEPPEEVKLVLDGQQRITALYIGLKGSITEKRPNRKWKKKDSWSRKKLYLNLLEDPDDESKEEHHIKYGFEFRKPSDTDTSRDAYWFEVGEVLGMEAFSSEVREIEEDVKRELEKYTDFSEPELAQKQQISRKNINRLIEAIRNKPKISFYVEDEEDRERIQEVFLRQNSAGTQLTNPEKLLSLMMSHWAYGKEEAVDAREQVQEFQKTFNQEWEGKFNFGLRFTLRYLLALSDEDVSFNLEEFDRDILSSMRETWEDETFEDSLQETLKILDSWRFDQDVVGSDNLLIPIAYFMYSRGLPDVSKDSELGRKNREKLLRFVSASIINQVYGSHTIRAIKNMIGTLREESNGEIFPFDQIQENLLKAGKSLSLNKEVLSEYLDDADYGSGNEKAILALLQTRTIIEREKYNIDHIFPQDFFDEEELLKRGVEEDKIAEVIERKDDIGNLQLLTEDENKTKRKKEFEDWLKTRDEEDRFLSENEIPKEEELYSFDNYLEFIEERRELIKKTLLEKYGPAEDTDN
jgi:hypothetical protein